MSEGISGISIVRPVGYMQVDSRKARPIRRIVCATPKCPDEPLEGRRFCAACTERLTSIKDDLLSEGRNMSLNGGNPKSRRKSKVRVKHPVCCAFGCVEPRIPPNRWCAEHADMEEPV